MSPLSESDSPSTTPVRRTKLPEEPDYASQIEVIYQELADDEATCCVRDCPNPALGTVHVPGREDFRMPHCVMESCRDKAVDMVRVNALSYGGNDRPKARPI